MEQRLFFLFSTAWNRLFRALDSESERQLGSSVTHVAALLHIARHEGCLQKELSTALGLNKSAITGLAKRMEKQGIIARKHCHQDARATRLYLSDKGKAVVSATPPLIKEMNRQIKGDFSEAEIQTVVRFLNHIARQFG